LVSKDIDGTGTINLNRICAHQWPAVQSILLLHSDFPDQENLTIRTVLPAQISISEYTSPRGGELPLKRIVPTRTGKHRMKATLRWGMGLVGLLLVTSFAQAWMWVSPVFWCPYPAAPNTCNSGYYLMDVYGNWTGPHYYLVPPNPPFGGVLPGATGRAIMAGNLPHNLLMSNQGMQVGNVPYVQEPRKQGTFSFGGPEIASARPGPQGMPYPGGPTPMAMQVPYGAPPMQYAGMPQYGVQPMPNAGYVPAQPMSWNKAGASMTPYGTIPSYHPHAHGATRPTMPMQPMTPMDTMQMPQAQPSIIINQFPMHPFTRSPRDFFMWGENMEDEARMRNRPFPVPR
jgi:hypothetical protein